MQIKKSLLFSEMLSGILSKTLIANNATKLASLNIQQTRNVRVNKPPWVPKSKSKAFRVPTLHKRDQEEADYMKPIWLHYKAEMRSMYQLFKTENKFSDKASLKAQEEKRAKIEEEQALLELNDKNNQELLQFQLGEEEQKLQIKKQQLESDLREKERVEKAYVQLAEDRVKRLKEKVKTFIDPNDLEFEIEKMLNERNDYNFSINTSGLMFKSGANVQRGDAFNTKYMPSVNKNETSGNI